MRERLGNPLLSCGWLTFLVLRDWGTWVYICIPTSRLKRLLHRLRTVTTTVKQTSVMHHTRQDASRYHKPRKRSRYCEPRHKRSTMFRLGNNGDVLVLYSTSIDDPQTGRAVYPIRYYLIRHEWFLQHERFLRTESRPNRQRAGRRKVTRNVWPSFRDVAGLQSARGLEAIDCILESQLFKCSKLSGNRMH